MCGTVAHRQNVVVAGNVAAARKVIGTLGEPGGHSIGTLQDAHSWLCGKFGEKEKEKRYVS